MEDLKVLLTVLFIAIISIVAVQIDSTYMSGMASTTRTRMAVQEAPMPIPPSQVSPAAIPKRAASPYVKDNAFPQEAAQFIPDSKPVCPDGCLWGGKGISVQMYNGVIITPKTNFWLSECDAPKEGCYSEGEMVKVRFKEHPYYKDPNIGWSMSGLQCINHVWVPQGGALVPCPPKLASIS